MNEPRAVVVIEVDPNYIEQAVLGLHQYLFKNPLTAEDVPHYLKMHIAIKETAVAVLVALVLDDHDDEDEDNYDEPHRCNTCGRDCDGEL